MILRLLLCTMEVEQAVVITQHMHATVEIGTTLMTVLFLKLLKMPSSTVKATSCFMLDSTQRLMSSEELNVEQGNSIRK